MDKSGEGFIDRSKVRILVCDNDAKSSQEVFTLLCRCSYEVTSVRSPRQVIDALNAEGPDIDIILSEVDLPMSKGFKLLKYIMRDTDLRRIPVIMMSAQDEVSVVVKCLKFGAADYLVKPLRTNELLNLWTHVWRRRRMLGLAEKSILNYDCNMVMSDPSNANTNSTTLFSDDTEDRSRKSINPDICISTHQEQETSATTALASAPVETLARPPGQHLPGFSDLQTVVSAQSLSCPMKGGLNIGESSAFFTYAKLSAPKTRTKGAISTNGSIPQYACGEVKFDASFGPANAINRRLENGESPQNLMQADDYPSSNRDSFSVDGSCTPPISSIFSRENSKESSGVHARNRAPEFLTRAPYPYYITGAMNQMIMPSSQVYQESTPDLNGLVSSTISPQYSHAPQYPPHITSFPYYPVSICLQPGRMPALHPWPPSYPSPASNAANVTKIDRREAALMKFRQKRKERCFDKKIRYANRKQLAERRPRVRGQFVRKGNGITVDLNGQPDSAEGDDEDEEYYEEDIATTNNIDSSPITRTLFYASAMNNMFGSI